MENSGRLRQFATIGLVGLVAFGISFYLDRKGVNDPNFECTFVARPNAASVKLGDLRGPIRKVSVEGYLSDPFEEVYDFEGRSTIMVDGHPRSYLARGSVFFWEPGKVGDLSIDISADEYARRDFTLITFDKHGSLSEIPNEAFAFDAPELKTIHPMNYRCSLIGPLPKASKKGG